MRPSSVSQVFSYLLASSPHRRTKTKACQLASALKHGFDLQTDTIDATRRRRGFENASLASCKQSRAWSCSLTTTLARLSPDPDCFPHSILLKRCRLRTNTNAINSRVRLCNTPEAWRMSVDRRPSAKEWGFETSSRNESTQEGYGCLVADFKAQKWYRWVVFMRVGPDGDS